MARSATFLAGITLGLLLAGACASQQDRGGRSPLPPPPPNPPQAPYVPEHPLEPGPGGSASRDVFRADSGRGYTIEVRDYLVPLDRQVTIDFGGAAVVEVRQGGGDISIAGTAGKVNQGTVFTVPDVDSLKATARGEPMLLRAWIYR